MSDDDARDIALVLSRSMPYTKYQVSLIFRLFDEIGWPTSVSFIRAQLNLMTQLNITPYRYSEAVRAKPRDRIKPK